jgi:hypothetical protein
VEQVRRLVRYLLLAVVVAQQLLVQLAVMVWAALAVVDILGL